VSEGGLEPPCP